MKTNAERIERQKVLAQLANRDGETEAETLARVVPVWNALPIERQNWFPEFAIGLQNRVKAQQQTNE